MKIRNVTHRGLRRFIERDDGSALPSAAIEKIRNIVTFLQDMDDVSELSDVPSWNTHQLAATARERGALPSPAIGG